MAKHIDLAQALRVDAASAGHGDRSGACRFCVRSSSARHRGQQPDRRGCVDAMVLAGVADLAAVFGILKLAALRQVGQVTVPR